MTPQYVFAWRHNISIELETADYGEAMVQDNCYNIFLYSTPHKSVYELKYHIGFPD